MDYFSQNEASQLVKTALNAGAIKLNGVRSNATECEASAKIDAAYMLELYRTLLGPDGAAGAVALTQQTLQQGAAQPQQATQAVAVPQQQGQQQQQQGRGHQRQGQNGAGQGQQQAQSNAQGQSQGQQAAAQPAAQASGAAPGAGGQDFQNFIPAQFRDAASQGAGAQGGAQASAAPGAGAGGAPDFQTFIPGQFRDAAAQGASQGTTQPAAQLQAATAQASAGAQQAANPGGGQPDFRKFIPEAFRGSVPETPGGQ